MDKKKSMVDEVYAMLKRDFTNNSIRPGEKLTTKKYAAKYMTSETPVKQALNRLVSEGLVEAIPGRGMFRKQLSFQSIREILEIRMMMELFYADIIIDNLDLYPAIVPTLESLTNDIHDTIISMSSIEDFMRLYELDKNFHNEYMHCSGNLQAIILYEQMGTHSYEAITYGKMSKERLLSGSVDEHFNVLNALRERDKMSLKEALHTHYENAVKTFEITFRMHEINGEDFTSFKY